MLKAHKKLPSTRLSKMISSIHTTSSKDTCTAENDKEGNRQSEDSNHKDITNHDLPSYEEVLRLRKAYFSKSVSVSYSNSGPLMIVGVSLKHVFK